MGAFDALWMAAVGWGVMVFALGSSSSGRFWQAENLYGRG